jgi:hypothetical protein
MNFVGLIKTLVFLLLIGVFVFNFSYALRTFYYKSVPQGQGKILIQAPIRMADWEDIGKVSDPVIDLQVKVKDTYQKVTFLIDSGAVISSLPREMAEKMDLELAFLKRIAFVGFGNRESFAYKGEMTILFNQDERTIPVVFTEGYGTRSILGRQGFFDQYIITFDKQRGVIEIKE